MSYAVVISHEASDALAQLAEYAPQLAEQFSLRVDFLAQDPMGRSTRADYPGPGGLQHLWYRHHDGKLFALAIYFHYIQGEEAIRITNVSAAPAHEVD